MTQRPELPATPASQPARTLMSRLAATFRFWAPSSRRPLPRVDADIGSWVPVWVIVGLTAVIAVAGAALVVQGPVGWFVLGGVIVALVVFPEGPATGIYTITIAVFLLLSGAEPFAGRVFVLIVVVHLVAVLHSLVSGLPSGTRLQLAAVREPLRRFIGAQVAAQALAGVGALVTGADLTMAWLPAAAAVGVAALAWGLDVRLRAGEVPEHRVR